MIYAKTKKELYTLGYLGAINTYIGTNESDLIVEARKIKDTYLAKGLRVAYIVDEEHVLLPDIEFTENLSVYTIEQSKETEFNVGLMEEINAVNYDVVILTRVDLLSEKEKAYFFGQVHLYLTNLFIPIEKTIDDYKTTLDAIDPKIVERTKELHIV